MINDSAEKPHKQPEPPLISAQNQRFLRGKQGSSAESINLSPKTIDWLTSIYAVANTASYLYRHFRSQNAVEDLARRHSVAELVSFVVQIDAKDQLTAEDVVSAYAATVALTFYDLNTVKKNGAKLETQKLRWIKPIIRLWEETYVATQRITLPHRSAARIERQQAMRSSGATQTSQIQYQHKLKIRREQTPETDSSMEIVEFRKGEK